MAVVVPCKDIHCLSPPPPPGRGGKEQQTKKAADKLKSPGRRRLRRKFLGGIRAQKGHSIFWGKWNAISIFKTGHLPRRKLRES